MSNENLQMQVITDAVQKSSNVQFVIDSPITDPGQKVKIRNKIFFSSHIYKNNNNYDNLYYFNN